MQEHTNRSIKAALFDFDGTISTLRHGWEQVMEPLMLEMIAGETPVTDNLRAEVRTYIDESTGIQTIHQMKWLNEAILRYGLNCAAPTDPWALKVEYNRRLMEQVAKRRNAVEEGIVSAEEYLVAGSLPFLRALKDRGVGIFVASGTDEADVREEARILGVLPYVDTLRGAQPMAESCAKEAVMRQLMEEAGLQGAALAVIGDGKVEIALGNSAGARTLGVASNESVRHGVDAVKRARLEKAQAQKIVGDFLALPELLSWLELEGGNGE